MMTEGQTLPVANRKWAVINDIQGDAQDREKDGRSSYIHTGNDNRDMPSCPDQSAKQDRIRSLCLDQSRQHIPPPADFFPHNGDQAGNTSSNAGHYDHKYEAQWCWQVLQTKSKMECFEDASHRKLE